MTSAVSRFSGVSTTVTGAGSSGSGVASTGAGAASRRRFDEMIEKKHGADLDEPSGCSSEGGGSEGSGGGGDGDDGEGGKR